MSIPFRAATTALVSIAVLAIAARWIAVDAAVVWMLRVALSSSAIAFVPGALIVLAWHPRPSFDVLEWAGLALAVSFGLNELLTIAALLVHWPPVVSLMLLAAVIAAAATRAAQRSATLDISAEHAVIGCVLAVLAVYLYAAGSGWDNVEDRIHIAIIERLSRLARPSFRNIYFSPGVVYTYPFPGTHYMLALMSRLGDMPAVFTYVKLRAFWGIAALVLLYGCALLMFESRRIAFASTLTAAAFVANGAFGAVPGMYWGQMAPFSHASDVAMGVLLPALLLLTCEVLASRDRREYWFSLIATSLLLLMLVIVHIREVAQFAVYLAAFAMTLVLTRGPWPLFRKVAAVLAATVAVVMVYRAWNIWAVPLVDALVEGHRRDLRDMYNAATWADLFGPPLPLLRNYMPAFQPFFYGWNALVILLSPAILFALRGRKLAWLIAASIAAYLLIVRYPVFAIPYTYATYFEILYTPVRNVIFFVYLLAGVGLYVIAALLARQAYAVLVAAALASGLAAIEAMRRLGPAASQRIDLLFWPVLAGYAILLLLLIWNGRRATTSERLLNPRPRWMVAFVIMLATVTAGSRIADAAVIDAHWVNRAGTPAALLASMPCSRRTDCPPPAPLVRLVQSDIPADAILAVDFNEDYQPALFMPQQMDVWTGGTDTLLEPETLFPRYFEYLKSARDAGADQPFFNASEPHERRAAFLRDLSVTHVLIDPPLYQTMKPVLEAETDLLSRRYDDGRWALYEVRRR